MQLICEYDDDDDDDDGDMNMTFIVDIIKLRCTLWQKTGQYDRSGTEPTT